jgi:mRNA-degrading endonuclease toxin of MazEF toxin-antitoxin module
MTKTVDKILRKGEIWLLSNPERIKEIGKDYRPVLVISNNERNEYSNSVVVLPLTTDDLEHISLTEVFINETPENGLDYSSKIQCESPFTWNKGIRFERKLGIVSSEVMKKVMAAWQIAFNW